MSLLKKRNVSFYAIKFQDFDRDSFDQLIESLPILNIQDRRCVEYTTITSLRDAEEQNFSVLNECLSFNIRRDAKTLPKRKLKNLEESAIAEFMLEAGLDYKTDISRHDLRMIKSEAKLDCSVGVTPREALYEVIVDLRRNVAYIDAGIPNHTLSFILYSEIFKEPEFVNPFAKRFENFRLGVIHPIFLYWIYSQSLNIKDEDDLKEGQVDVSSGITLKDRFSKISIDGKVKSLFRVYNSLGDGREVKECNLGLKLTKDTDLFFTIRAGDLAIRNLSNFGRSRTMEQTDERMWVNFADTFMSRYDALVASFAHAIKGKSNEEIYDMCGQDLSLNFEDRP